MFGRKKCDRMHYEEIEDADAGLEITNREADMPVVANAAPVAVEPEAERAPFLYDYDFHVDFSGRNVPAHVIIDKLDDVAKRIRDDRSRIVEHELAYWDR